MQRDFGVCLGTLALIVKTMIGLRSRRSAGWASFGNKRTSTSRRGSDGSLAVGRSAMSHLSAMPACTVSLARFLNSMKLKSRQDAFEAKLLLRTTSLVSRLNASMRLRATMAHGVPPLGVLSPTWWAHDASTLHQHHLPRELAPLSGHRRSEQHMNDECPHDPTYRPICANRAEYRHRDKPSKGSGRCECTGDVNKREVQRQAQVVPRSKSEHRSAQCKWQRKLDRKCKRMAPANMSVKVAPSPRQIRMCRPIQANGTVLKALNTLCMRLTLKRPVAVGPAREPGAPKCSYESHPTSAHCPARGLAPFGDACPPNRARKDRLGTPDVVKRCSLALRAGSRPDPTRPRCPTN